jgi:hypothetical protein
MKNYFEYLGLYYLGFSISFLSIQKVNDIFYKTVIKREIILDENDFNNDLIPRSIISKRAKGTFVKHKIEASQKDETIVYQNYIELSKGDMNYDQQLKFDIFDKNMSKVVEKKI